jgi:hypothetical protein
MSGYTSGNKAPTLMAQAPNRKGNIDKHPAKKGGGVTSITGSMGGLSCAPGCQGAPSAGGNVVSRNQKVQVSMPKEYVCHSTNTGYMSSGRKSWEK